MGLPKIENLKLLLYGAETARGTLITYPYYGVAGAYGTSLPARRVRAGEIFTNFGFWEGCHEGVTRVSRDRHETVTRPSRDRHEGAHRKTRFGGLENRKSQISFERRQKGLGKPYNPTLLWGR